MDLPAVKLLCLEQRNRSLMDHTQDFLDLVCLTHYTDDSLSVFYHTGKGTSASEWSPGDFAAYVEWVLVMNGLDIPVGPEEDTSLTPNSESSQTPPREMDMTPEPTADKSASVRKSDLARVHI